MSGFAAERERVLAVVAVVDSPAEDVWVWWVAIDASLAQSSLSRLCGAWRVARHDAETLEALTFRRIVLPTESGSRALAGARVQSPRVLDAGATHQAILDEVAALQSAFTAEQDARPASKRMVTPEWPEPRPRLDLETPPAPGPGSAIGEQQRALGIAEWVADLCATWSAIEERRLSRAFLRGLGGPEARMLPVVVNTPSAASPQDGGEELGESGLADYRDPVGAGLGGLAAQ